MLFNTMQCTMNGNKKPNPKKNAKEIIIFNKIAFTNLIKLQPQTYSIIYYAIFA